MVRGGKLKERDPLFELVLKWITQAEVRDLCQDCIFLLPFFLGMIHVEIAQRTCIFSLLQHEKVPHINHNNLRRRDLMRFVFAVGYDFDYA